jgi:hypothetical protein
LPWPTAREEALDELAVKSRREPLAESLRLLIDDTPPTTAAAHFPSARRVPGAAEAASPLKTPASSPLHDDGSHWVKDGGLWRRERSEVEQVCDRPATPGPHPVRSMHSPTRQDESPVCPHWVKDGGLWRRERSEVEQVLRPPCHPRATPSPQYAQPYPSRRVTCVALSAHDTGVRRTPQVMRPAAQRVPAEEEQRTHMVSVESPCADAGEDSLIDKLTLVVVRGVVIAGGVAMTHQYFPLAGRWLEAHAGGMGGMGGHLCEGWRAGCRAGAAAASHTGGGVRQRAAAVAQVRVFLTVPHCVSLTVPHCVSHCVSLTVSNCVSHCVSLTVPHCVSHCVSLTVSLSGGGAGGSLRWRGGAHCGGGGGAGDFNQPLLTLPQHPIDFNQHPIDF